MLFPYIYSSLSLKKIVQTSFTKASNLTFYDLCNNYETFSYIWLIFDSFSFPFSLWKKKEILALPPFFFVNWMVYSHVLSFICLQAVDHPYLVECSSSSLARSGRTTNVGYVEQTCGLCHDPAKDPIVSCILFHFPKKRNRKYKTKEKVHSRNLIHH